MGAAGIPIHRTWNNTVRCERQSVARQAGAPAGMQAAQRGGTGCRASAAHSRRHTVLHPPTHTQVMMSAGHTAGECTHWCSPGAYSVWVWSLWRTLLQHQL